MRKHRALVGYVILLVGMVVAVTAYQMHMNREFNHRDAQSCAQRNRLAQNQRSVLGGLIAVLVIETDESKHPGTRASLLAILNDLRARQPQAGPEIC